LGENLELCLEINAQSYNIKKGTHSSIFPQSEMFVILNSCIMLCKLLAEINKSICTCLHLNSGWETTAWINWGNSDSTTQLVTQTSTDPH